MALSASDRIASIRANNSPGHPAQCPTATAAQRLRARWHPTSRTLEPYQSYHSSKTSMPSLPPSSMLLQRQLATFKEWNDSRVSAASWLTGKSWMRERCSSPASCVALRRSKKTLLTCGGLTSRLYRLSGVVALVSISPIVLAETVLIQSSELVGGVLQDAITTIAGIEHEIISLRENFDGKGPSRVVKPQSGMAEELSARHKSLMITESNDRAIRHRREIHPCRGGLQLIKGDDRGGIDRCMKKDLTPAELERLSRGGIRGTYLFWKCDSCEFRIKYFVSKSRAASLQTNDDHILFRDSNIRCSRAFLAMSHLEQREDRRFSSSYGPPRYTCLICALHRPASRPGRNHTFSNRDDYAQHVEDMHIDGTPIPAFVLRKLCIEHDGKLPVGSRRELWTT